MGHAHAGHNQFKFNLNTDGLLVRRSRVNGALELVVTESICQRILNLQHHLLIVGRRGPRRFYGTVRGEFSWPHMAADLERIFSECTD